MKIHIVQKGDTLWELAKKYNVDFEELKQVNSHLSSPDMIMPGMKIKIPSSKKPVKKEMQVKKETKKVKEEPLYKDISPKPMPVIKEDDQIIAKEIKAEMPKMPEKEMPKMPEMKEVAKMPKIPPMQPIIHMPKIEQDMTKYTTIYKHDSKEKVKKEKEKHVMPTYKPMPMYHHPMPFMPICCHVVHPCCPPPMPMGHYHMPSEKPVAMKPTMPSSCGQGSYNTHYMPSYVKPWEGHSHQKFYPHHTYMDYPKPPSTDLATEKYYEKDYPYSTTAPVHQPHPYPEHNPFPSFKREEDD